MTPSMIRHAARIRRRSVTAYDLRTPKFRQRVVKSRKAYSRKSQKPLQHKDF